MDLPVGESGIINTGRIADDRWSPDGQSTDRLTSATNAHLALNVGQK